MAASRPAKVPHFLDPMAPSLVTELPRGPEWLYEIKWDGYRCEAIKRAGAVVLLSRNHKSLASDHPDIVAAVASLPAKDLVLDGELVALGADGRPSFQALQNRRRGEANVFYYVFDLMWLDGDDLTGVPLVERKKRLAQLVAGSSLRLSSELPGDVEAIVQQATKHGLEGIVAKRRDSVYLPGGKGPTWQKLKLDRRQPFVVGGYGPPAAKFDRLVVGYYDGKKLMFCAQVRNGFNPLIRRNLAPQLQGNASIDCPFVNLPQIKKDRFGSGITGEDMASIRWVKPRIVVDVGFVEWTDAGVLRHPKYRGLHPDIDPQSVERE